ncbi:MAG: tRNA (N6-threonylcarbamoyladenosine(37)-N6)-methyltransferase TrmO [Anaerolineales bacterium]
MDSYKKSESFVMEPIGIIHSPYNTKSETPIQPIYSSTIGKVEIFSDYLEGLIDLEEFSHIYLIYVFDRSLKYQLQVKPFKDNQLHGLFSTRHPNRPNPIGISIVQIIEISGSMIFVEGIDVLDKTPLLDIKPYIPDFDVRSDTKTGWYERLGSGSSQ